MNNVAPYFINDVIKLYMYILNSEHSQVLTFTSNTIKNYNAPWLLGWYIPETPFCRSKLYVNLNLVQGKLGEHKNWTEITRAAIAENILNLTRLSKERRTMDLTIKNPILWLALASHCVLHPEHAERLSSGQWLKSEKSKPVLPRVS